MIEMTFPQPLATLAVKGVVKVLVVPEPPKCEKCHGRGWYLVDSSFATADMQKTCGPCLGDGLARWPGEVTIRSSDERPGIAAELAAVHAATETMDAYDAARLEFSRGEVVGTVTVEAAVPICHGGEPWGKDEEQIIVLDVEGRLMWRRFDDEPVDIAEFSDQLAFQGFPVGHTALILGGETDE